MSAAPVDRAELDQLVDGSHANPHRVLGPHLHGATLTVRALRPGARSIQVAWSGGVCEMQHEYRGVWVGEVPVDRVVDYRLVVGYEGRTPHRVDDPYRYLPTLGEVDLHLIGEGRHEELWRVLGAHVRQYEGPTGSVSGTSFALWAPNARGVRLIGDHNSWDGVTQPMRSLGASGVWELFVPDLGSGSLYKFAVLGSDGRWRDKADPMAFWAQTPPETASRIYASHYVWGDDDWLQQRAAAAPVHERPMSAYEVHLGSWRRDRSYLQLAGELVDYVTSMGFTHVELLPVMEHPYGGSWGYHVTSYYAPTSRFGEPDDFRALVDALHQAGIGVIVDWVPAHFATDPWALPRFDGTPLYEHPDPYRGEHPEWGSYIFDYGRPEVRNFLVANALYWLREFHVDALRVDGVASMLYLDYSRQPGQWTPNLRGGRENLDAVSFLQEMNATCYRVVPGTATIAEESTAWPGVTRPTHLGGLGFGLKWDLGWMHDTLGYLQHDPVHRSYHHSQMTFAMMYAYSEQFVLPLSHDEVVHGKRSLVAKMPGDRWQQLATLRAYLAYMWAHPGKQLVFMGIEIGQESEWAEQRELDWHVLQNAGNAGVQSLVRDLNGVYRATPALWARDGDPSGFSWIDPHDASGNTFSFLRSDDSGSCLACIANFAAVPHEGYRLGLPQSGRWRELVNTDAAAYGGSGVGNLGEVLALDEPWHGQPASTTLRVPPLGTLWLTAVD